MKAVFYGVGRLERAEYAAFSRRPNLFFPKT